MAARRDDVARLSPRSLAFVEVDDPTDLAILRRMSTDVRPLLGGDSPFEWSQGDFNMTADADCFVERTAAEADG